MILAPENGDSIQFSMAGNCSLSPAVPRWKQKRQMKGQPYEALMSIRRLAEKASSLYRSALLRKYTSIGKYFHDGKGSVSMSARSGRFSVK